MDNRKFHLWCLYRYTKMKFDIKYMCDVEDIFRFVRTDYGWSGYTYGYATLGDFKDLNEVFKFVKEGIKYR